MARLSRASVLPRSARSSSDHPARTASTFRTPLPLHLEHQPARGRSGSTKDDAGRWRRDAVGESLPLQAVDLARHRRGVETDPLGEAVDAQRPGLREGAQQQVARAVHATVDLAPPAQQLEARASTAISVSMACRASEAGVPVISPSAPGRVLFEREHSFVSYTEISCPIQAAGPREESGRKAADRRVTPALAKAERDPVTTPAAPARAAPAPPPTSPSPGAVGAAASSW